MNPVLKNISLTILIIIITQNFASAQLDSVMDQCEKYLSDEYLSDGQQYLSLITGDQIAEFSVLFYGGNTYRIITCGGDEENSLIFVVYDKYRNELFRNSEYDNVNYWDFQFASTIECFIEAELINKNNKSGFAVLLIGLKK
ncbi:MAG: hypothetical protein K8R54_01985 [Bacteroidales bacterium]|nr:hypothetical protein [Bacteroidales bacterium]